MTNLLLLDNGWDGTRKFYEICNKDDAIKELKNKCIKQETQEIFLYEVNPERETQITSGYEIFTSDFKVRSPGSQDIWCSTCGYLWEAATKEEIDNCNIQTYKVEKNHYTEIHHWIHCVNNCLGRMEFLVKLYPKKLKKPKRKCVN